MHDITSRWICALSPFGNAPSQSVHPKERWYNTRILKCLGDIIFFSLSLVQITTSSAVSLTDANVVLFSCVNLLWSRNLSGRQRRHLIFRLCASLNLSWFRALIYSNIWGRPTLSSRFVSIIFVSGAREKHRPARSHRVLTAIHFFSTPWNKHPYHIDVNVFIKLYGYVKWKKINDNSLQNVTACHSWEIFSMLITLLAQQKYVLFEPENVYSYKLELNYTQLPTHAAKYDLLRSTLFFSFAKWAFFVSTLVEN